MDGILDGVESQPSAAISRSKFGIYHLNYSRDELILDTDTGKDHVSFLFLLQEIWIDLQTATR